MKIAFSIVIFLIVSSSSAQNIYDKEHSLKYADFLFNSGDFISASEEYERIIIMLPDSLFVKERLLLSYYNAAYDNKCDSIINLLFGSQSIDYPKLVMKVLTNIKIRQNRYQDALDALSEYQNLSSLEILEYRSAMYILLQQYDVAISLLDSSLIAYPESEKLSSLYTCCQKAKKNTFKNPVLAAGLSTFLPGSGKAYADDLQNGIRSFYIIGLYTWQSYRAFHFDGIKSPYGWIFGTLATGFYTAGVYGAYASAERSNRYKNTIIENEVKSIILNKEFLRN
jgi:tetratricopeptide (TPR) repeat protein